MCYWTCFQCLLLLQLLLLQVLQQEVLMLLGLLPLEHLWLLLWELGLLLLMLLSPWPRHYQQQQ